VILPISAPTSVKVEPPTGDMWRIGHKIPPQPQAKDPYPWHLANRNKRGITLDLKNPGSRQVLEKLVKLGRRAHRQYAPSGAEKSWQARI